MYSSIMVSREMFLSKCYLITINRNKCTELKKKKLSKRDESTLERESAIYADSYLITPINVTVTEVFLTLQLKFKCLINLLDAG